MSTDTNNTNNSNTEIINADYIEIDETKDNQSGNITLDEAKAVIEYNYRAPQIILEDTFREAPAKDQIKYLHKLASAMNHAASLLQDERNALLIKVDMLKEDVKNAELQATLQKSINHQLMERMNETTQENALLIQEEQRRVKQLETVVKAAGLKLD